MHGICLSPKRVHLHMYTYRVERKSISCSIERSRAHLENTYYGVYAPVLYLLFTSAITKCLQQKYYKRASTKHRFGFFTYHRYKRISKRRRLFVFSNEHCRTNSCLFWCCCCCCSISVAATVAAPRAAAVAAAVHSACS